MTPRRYGPLAYVPIHRRPPLTWPNGARVALWVNPNVEFFGLDDVMPSNLNDRVPRDLAKIPNVRNWAVRDYGNRVGIWRLMEVLTRYGIRAAPRSTARSATITWKSSRRATGSAGNGLATTRPMRCG
jgi:allantoinase